MPPLSRLWPLAALYLLLINLASFWAMGRDKSLARRGGWRIPEATLLLLDALGGSLGGLLGMLLFRHKTRRLKFTLLTPLFLLAQSALLIWLFL